MMRDTVWIQRKYTPQFEDGYTTGGNPSSRPEHCTKHEQRVAEITQNNMISHHGHRPTTGLVSDVIAISAVVSSSDDSCTSVFTIAPDDNCTSVLTITSDDNCTSVFTITPDDN